MTARRPIDIEAFWHWAIARQKAHVLAEKAGLWGPEAAAAGLAPTAISGDGCAGLMRVAGLGCRPDGGGIAAMLGDRCDPDAETAYLTARRVFAADAPTLGLILSFAKSGERPGWGAHIKELEARPRMTWDLRVAIARPGGKAPFCPVDYYERGADIDAARLFYRAWWVGLRRLALALANEGKLKRVAVSGPAAPERPWERA